MRPNEKHRYVVNEAQAHALLNALFGDENSDCCWVQSAKSYLEGVLAVARENQDPAALKWVEGVDERDVEQNRRAN